MLFIKFYIFTSPLFSILTANKVLPKARGLELLN